MNNSGKGDPEGIPVFTGGQYKFNFSFFMASNDK